MISFLAGTKNIWWLSLCKNPLPVVGQVVLMLEVWLGLLEDFYLRIHPRCFASHRVGFQDNGNPNVMRLTAFIAKSKDPILTLLSSPY